MKSFLEALKDGYEHIRSITDRELLNAFRNEGARVDDEGYYRAYFGASKEIEERVVPIGEDGCYYIAKYLHGVLLNEKLLVWTKPN